MRVGILWVVGSVAVLTLSTASAQEADLRAGLARCAGITDSLERLVCYDALSNRARTPATATGSASGNAIRGDRDLKPPRKLKDVKAVYPYSAMQSRVQGVIIMEIQISPEGKVVDVNVKRSIPGLEQAAVDAVRQWVYEPTLVNGVAVPRILTVTVGFNLR